MNLASGIVRITVGTGGAGYSVAPAVSLSGGGGTGAAAVAQLAGTVVDAILVTNPGNGYTSAPSVSITGGSGSGAAATASVLSFAGTNVISLFTGRFNDLYGVDGLGRGFRWLGDKEYLEPIGISKPTSAPTVSMVSATTGQRVRSIAIVNGGAGYFQPPAVTFSGGGLTDGHTNHAQGRARISNARVVGVTVDSRGSGYLSAPAMTFSGGIGSGATLAVSAAGTLADAAVVAFGTGYTMEPTCTIGGGVVSVTLTTGGTNYGTVAPTVSFSSGSAAATCSVSGGRVHAVTITNSWAGYTTPPTITFNHATGTGAAATCSLDGLTGAKADVIIDSVRGIVLGLNVVNAGTGAVTTPGLYLTSATTVSSTTGGSTTLTVGSGASLTPICLYGVSSVVVVSGGTNFLAPPAIGFRPLDGGAAAIAGVSGGSLSGVTVLSGGVYRQPPSAVIEATDARAIAFVSDPLLGKYKCCLRYIDATPASKSGPRPSSISEMATVTADTGASGLNWAWTNNAVESRVDKIELWRTTADQELVLYRVAVLSKVDGVLPRTYSDTLSDDDLLDPTRTDFGIMPVVMPSGQLNARRFDPPVESASQACMFQDRAWYTADSTGAKPNSLWHSEIDEPESAPSAYEIVLQENAADSDAIVGLVPFGSSLLIFQSRHLYRLQYVSQPLIDSSMVLVAYRGTLNARCVDVYDGVAFCVDSYGMYAFDGQSQETLSVPVDNYWRDEIIDFSKSKYFHVAVNPNDRVVRFYYCQSGDGTYPTRALCFCLATKAWWEETFATAVPAATTLSLGRRNSQILGGSGQILKHAPGVVDSGATAIPYEYRSGNYALTDEPSREIGVLYKPTAATADLQLRVHYNGSASPRPNAIMSDRGDGVTVATGSTCAVLDMRSDRSSLGSAPGYATARYAGRIDVRSAGGDKHAAVAVGGEKTTGEVILYGVTVGGLT